ncbi:MAG: tetratricopeptide repeat protein [Bdellovibrionota bacterium]
MKNLNTIKKIVSDGQFAEAHTALEDLLEMGPGNIEAVKLKAALFAHVGRFEDEENAWRRVIEIDNEDEDAIEYYQGLQLEDRERYYFRDPLPHGGARYLTLNRKLIAASWTGLLIVASFLGISRLGLNFFVNSPYLLLYTFFGLTLMSSGLIYYAFHVNLHSISITRDGLEFATRFRKKMYPWKEIDQLILGHSDDLETGKLTLIVKPKDTAMPSVSLDITPGQTTIAARRHVLAEIVDYYPAVRHEAMSQVLVNSKNHLRF